MSLRACLFACGIMLRCHLPRDASVAANSTMLVFPMPMEWKSLLYEPEPQDWLSTVHLLIPEPVTMGRVVMVYFTKLEVDLPQN